MELIIGKTAYKTNEYLFLGESSSGIIAESNINYLTSLYKTHKMQDLEAFSLTDTDSYALKKELEKHVKRPGTIILEMDNKTTLFLRDDLFFKINNDIKKDPVLDYTSYVKIENKIPQNLTHKTENTYTHKLKI